MTDYSFKNLPTWITLSGKFDETNFLHLSEIAGNAGNTGTLKLSILQHGRASQISNTNISIESSAGKIAIYLGYNDAQVDMGLNSSGAFNMRLWRKSTVYIGSNTTSGGTRIICDMSTVEIGADCMLSDSVLIQSADQHGIVNLKTGELVNNHHRTVTIGEHVWLGRGVTVMADSNIGNGCIIGTAAIVTADIPQFSIAVGVPAKAVKSEMTWSRSPVSLDAMSRHYLISNEVQQTTPKDPSMRISESIQRVVTSDCPDEAADSAFNDGFSIPKIHD